MQHSSNINENKSVNDEKTNKTFSTYFTELCTERYITKFKIILILPNCSFMKVSIYHFKKENTVNSALWTHCGKVLQMTKQASFILTYNR